MENKLLMLAVAIAVVATYLWMDGYFQTEGFAPVNLSPLDADMVMYNDPNAFGTTDEVDARWENLSVRPESQGAPGHEHGCKCGYPSKLTIDGIDSHHRLQHVCAPCGDDVSEPAQLGHWWKRKDCSDPSSVGLNQRPYCTNCGN